MHSNLPTSRFPLKCRCTKEFATGGVSETPPVEVPYNPPSKIQRTRCDFSLLTFTS